MSRIKAFLPLNISPHSKWIFIFLLIILFSILVANLSAVAHNCFNSADLGIYHQAITELNIKNLNPYITVRDVKIFNDHFDPVIFLAAFFVKLFDNSPHGTVIFEFLWLLIFVFITSMSVYKEGITKRDQQAKPILLILWMIIFSRGILTGILSPVHPTLWSIVPLFFVCKYIKEDKLNGIIFSSLALCLFKEIFPPALISLSMYYALRKRWNYFLPLFLIGVAGTVFGFYLRPLWMGEFYPYHQSLFSSSLEQWILKVFISGDYSGIFKLFYPFFIPFYILYKHEIKGTGFKHFVFPIFFLIIPIFGVHFINRNIWLHWASITIGPLLAIISLSSVPFIIAKNKKLLIWTCLFFLINGFSRHKIGWEIIIRTLEDIAGSNYIERLKGPYTRCSLTSENRNTIKQVKDILNTKAKDKYILSSGGIIPQIIARDRKIYHLGGYSRKRDHYDMLLLGLNNSENGYPMTKEKIKKIKKSCSKFARKIYLDNDYYYLIEGNISRSCL